MFPAEFVKYLSWDLGPLKPWEWEAMDSWEWTEAQAVQRQWRKGVEDANDEQEKAQRIKAKETEMEARLKARVAAG